MSVVHTVSKGVIWNTAATVIGKALIFTNVFLVLMHFSVYEYGFSELIMSVVAMGSVVLLPGLTATITADLAVERARGATERMNGIFHQFFFLQLVLGFLIWAVLFFAASPIAVFAGNALAGHFLKIISFIFLITPLRTMSGVLAAVMLRFFDQSFYGVFEEFFKFGLILTLIVWLNLGVLGLMYAIVISQLLTVLIYAPRTYSAYQTFAHTPSPDRVRLWHVFGEHRKWSIGASYVGTLAQNARVWIIKFFLGTEAVGLFAFAYGIFSHVASLMPLTTVLTPVIPRYVDKRDQLARILRASVKLQLLVATVFLIGAYGTSYLFVLLLFPKYLAAVPVLYIILLTVIPNSVLTLFTPVFNAFKEQRSLLLSNILKLLSIVIASPVAIFLFGLTGAGIELVITSLINGGERYMRLKKFVPEFRFGFATFFKPDAYEREAMQTVRKMFMSAGFGFERFTRSARIDSRPTE